MKNILIRMLDTLGWLWCIPEEQSANPVMVKFLRTRMPIFWVMGPPRCGKTTIAERLADLIDYDLIQCSQLIKEAAEKSGYEGIVVRDLLKTTGSVTDEIVINLIVKVILETYENATGYIIDGFPIDLKQGKEFIETFRKPSIIIFACLTDNDILSRTSENDVNDSQILLDHNEWMRKLNEIYRIHERKTLKIVTNKPSELICKHLVNYLNDHYGYSFK